MSRRRARTRQASPSEVIARAEKKLRQAEFFLDHLRASAVPGRSGERMEFYFSASLTAAQSAFYVLRHHDRATFESEHHRWRRTRSGDERVFLNRMVALRDDDVHYGTLDAANLPTYVDAARVPGVRAFGPPGAFAEAQNPDGTTIRAPNALVAVQALYFKHAGKNVRGDGCDAAVYRAAARPRGALHAKGRRNEVTDARLWHPWLRINRVLRAMLQDALEY
jgi:hypothetical protein